MPIHSSPGGDGRETVDAVGPAYLVTARRQLAEALGKIEHCFGQLEQQDTEWKAEPSHNSIQNIVLHLCGNLQQWIEHGVGGSPDSRDRPGEFAAQSTLAKDSLLDRLRTVVEASSACLAACPPAQLLRPRRIQGFETTVLDAIFGSVSHFVGHTNQIVYITRLRLGDRYRFEWSPQTAEQGAAP